MPAPVWFGCGRSPRKYAPATVPNRTNSPNRIFWLNGGDIMNAYRQQQLSAAELIEQGATAEQIAAVYGWTKTRAEPEQEPIEQPKQKRKSKLLRILFRLLK